MSELSYFGSCNASSFNLCEFIFRTTSGKNLFLKRKISSKSYLIVAKGIMVSL